MYISTDNPRDLGEEVAKTITQSQADPPGTNLGFKRKCTTRLKKITQKRLQFREIWVVIFADSPLGGGG